MSSTETSTLPEYSRGLVDLVSKTALGVVAVKTARYRVASGVCLGPDLIAAADHSLKREDRIGVVTGDGSEAHAKVLGRVGSLDVVILHTEAGTLTPLPAADPANLKAGALIAVVGRTIDAGPSASIGILGAIGQAHRTWRGGTLDPFLRLDVNLYPSQSGAAVVDVDGGLIGLATPALLRHAGVAVPLATLQRIAHELQTQGRIRHGYLGVAAQPVSVPATLAEKVGKDIHMGLMLLTVEPESPAGKAGLQLGDILVTLAGKPIADLDELQDALRSDSIGKTLEIVVIRGGQPVHAAITVEERPAAKSRTTAGE